MIQNVSDALTQLRNRRPKRVNVRPQKYLERRWSPKARVAQNETNKSSPKLAHFPPDMIFTQKHSGLSGKSGLSPNVLNRAADKNNVSGTLWCRHGERREMDFSKPNSSNHQVNKSEVASAIPHCLKVRFSVQAPDQVEGMDIRSVQCQ
jgi:hypothetical protein